MNHNRILRVLNVLFLSCGYHVHWFSTSVRKFQLTLVACVYFLCLMGWYGICLQQHFADSSIFKFLRDFAPILYSCIHLHLLLGIKVMIFSVYEMRYIVRALNNLVKALMDSTTTSWSWQESVSYILLFSGLVVNFGFILYIMIQMEFMMPTLRQIMHVTAMCLPHFAIACSVKLANVTIWIARIDLQRMNKIMEETFKNETLQGITVAQVEDKNSNSVELTPIPKQLMNPQKCLKNTQSVVEQLTLVSTAVHRINNALQTQLMLFCSMNSVGLLGATYSIVYYKLSWHLMLEGALGNSFMAFNIGVFVFVFWDYTCLCLTNMCLEKEKDTFLSCIDSYLMSKSTLPKNIRSLLKEMRNEIVRRLKMRIFFTAPMAKQTFILVNVLLGLMISTYMVYIYFKEQIEMLQMRLDAD